MKRSNVIMKKIYTIQTFIKVQQINKNYKIKLKKTKKEIQLSSMKNFVKINFGQLKIIN